MPRFRCACVLLICSVLIPLCAAACGSDFDALIQESCIQCHDADTTTRLDFSKLDRDFESVESFRRWLHIFDRVEKNEMPPPDETQPNEELRQEALQFLREKLEKASLESQKKQGRVPSRRLSRAEYEHTLHELLGIGGDLAKHLPPENESGAFDVVASSQEISRVHVRGWLHAADLALDEAIELGPKPAMRQREIDYFNSPYIQMWLNRTVRQGGGTIFKTDTDIVTFRGENYVFRSDHNGYRPPVPGKYKISIKAAAHQPRSSISVSLKRQNDQQGDSELLAAWDLVGDKYRQVSTTTYLRPDDFIYVSADELEPAPNGQVIYGAQPAKDFGGEGVKIRRLTIEGPLETTWPPQRTRRLFPGLEWKTREAKGRRFDKNKGRNQRRAIVYEPILVDSPREHIRIIVSEFASRAWRREVSEKEIEALVALADPSLSANRDFVSCVRVPLRAILVSPQLIIQEGKPGLLNGTDLAKRLSYFLWRGPPDQRLIRLANKNRLADPATLAAEVSRMLLDSKRDRFVDEFLGQWLALDRIDATTPDVYLYPEFDDVLRQSMLAETREFFGHLIKENLSVDNLIDSDFTFLNRKLAEHYGIENVEGEFMRKVELDSTSVRGGILTHASIAKVTANGTVTTPVKRGNFVLTNLLGLPPNPPPPGVGSIEPDTRGATTIRETLEKHQNIESCAICHRQLDPPGFAMECFDPIGTFRNRYRNSKGVDRPVAAGLRFKHLDYAPGNLVDSSGITADGFKFSGIREYKAHLKKSKEQIARHLVGNLIAFSTGAEVQFADREQVEKILMATQSEGYRLKSLIQQVVASPMFRNR